MTTDLEKALTYKAAADTFRIDAAFYTALAADTQHRSQPELASFEVAYRNGLAERYRDMAAFCTESAAQAETLAAHYSAHADGEDMSLSGSAS